jgi:iron complex transport system substrate-binding protein
MHKAFTNGLWVLLSVLIGCQSSQHADNPPDAGVQLKYAVGFSVQPEGKVKRVTVHHPYPGATGGYQYLLVPRGETVPEHEDNVQVIQTPVQKIVCTSTTHIPLLDFLGETHSLVGFPTTDYISSEKMRKRIDEGHVTDLGIDKGMDLEVLFTLKPDLVMGYTMTKDLGQLKKISELGIPVVINAEYLEKHPLGRAEWIKFMALFFDKEKEADSVFHKIEENYLATQQMASAAKHKPTVLSGVLYGSAWFLPGGKNYAARLLQDAGMDYLWGDDESGGFLELSFESVYSKAKSADLWIGVGTYATLREMQAAESRYALFAPFANGRVYTYNARQGAKGGSAFLELGYLRPDLILQDLVKIAHPELLPEHELYFHRALR